MNDETSQPDQGGAPGETPPATPSTPPPDTGTPPSEPSSPGEGGGEQPAGE